MLYTFEMILDGDEQFITHRFNIEAGDAFAAWRRIGGQLVNYNEGRVLPLSVKLLDRVDSTVETLNIRVRPNKAK